MKQRQIYGIVSSAIDTYHEQINKEVYNIYCTPGGNVLVSGSEEIVTIIPSEPYELKIHTKDPILFLIESELEAELERT